MDSDDVMDMNDGICPRCNSWRLKENSSLCIFCRKEKARIEQRKLDDFLEGNHRPFLKGHSSSESIELKWNN